LGNREITYTLTRETTQRQTGFFAAVPDKNFTPDEALALLTQRPLDDFLHRHVLALIGKMPPDALQQILDQWEKDNNAVCRALAAEYLFIAKGREHLDKRFSLDEIRELSQHTPLIHLRSFLEPDQVLHRQWTALFRANLQQLDALPHPDKSGLPPLLSEPVPTLPTRTIAGLVDSFTKTDHSIAESISPEQTAEIAADRLEQAGVELGQLMRHESSLSPIGLLRTWRFTSRVDNRRNRYRLSGEQTSYGRGLTLDTARASLMMEITERCSAFASVSEQGLENFQNDYPMRYACFSELTKNNTTDMAAIDPNNLAPEVSYQNQRLHWVIGEMPNPNPNTNDNRSLPVWVPVQCLFLFCNLDEPALFSGLGSTGLASGNTPEQAKVSALLEIVERHQAATVPYDLSTGFQLVAGDTRIAALLDAYRKCGINLWFQDITPPNGIPCCRCFVKEKTGEIHVGAASHLNARRAIVSAITENTCPFPNPPPTQSVPPDLTLVGYENLPDYSTNDPSTDLALMESLLIQNNCQPCYVDLTRADISLPVVKAIVPRMELLGDFDDYSRIHPELYQNYLSLFKSRGT